MTIHANASGPMTLSEAHEFVRKTRAAANHAAIVDRHSQPVTVTSSPDTGVGRWRAAGQVSSFAP